MITKIFFEHPSSNKMTYKQHLYQAWVMAFQMLLGFIVLFIHGLFPILFQKTGSNIIKELHKKVLLNAPPLTTEELNAFIESKKV
jgi:hypothetical protein